MKPSSIIGIVVAGILGWCVLMVGAMALGAWYGHRKLPPPKPITMKVVYVERAASGRPALVDPHQRAP